MKEFMDSFGLLVVVACIALASGFVVGMVATNGVWREDCEKLGAHRHGSNVYDCKPRELRK